jgi:hypothetical protein
MVLDRHGLIRMWRRRSCTGDTDSASQGECQAKSEMVRGIAAGQNVSAPRTAFRCRNASLWNACCLRESLAGPRAVEQDYRPYVGELRQGRLEPADGADRGGR